MIAQLLSRLKFLLHPKRVEALDEELQFHLEQAEHLNRTRGMPPGEAHRQAMLAFGGLAQTRERCYQQRPQWRLSAALHDLRYAFRGLRRNSAFTATAIIVFTLAIGATTAVFSVVDRILFRDLPYAQDDRIVSVGMVQSLERQEFMLGGFFFDWRSNQQPFSAMASQGTYARPCDLIDTNPAQLGCLRVQAGFLPMLGVMPLLGRNFTAAEDSADGPAAAVLSYGVWVSHYGHDPAILNHLINLDGSAVRVVGVLPKWFEPPTLQPADVLLPMGLDEAQERGSKLGSPMRTFARLKPGLSIAQAKAQMMPLFLHTQANFLPSEIRNDFHLSIRSLRDRQTQDVQTMSWILLGSVLAVLWIACANLASLMLARGAARQHELAVRAALGASRSRLVGQTLTEAFLLSLSGAVAGIAFAELLLRVFIAIAPAGIPFLDRASIDMRVAAISFLVSLICGLCSGLLPALQRPGSVGPAARMATFGKHAGLRRALVAGQIAVSMILLSAAGLLLRSFQKIEEQHLGMNPGGVLTARIALPSSRYDSGEKKMQFYLAAEASIRRVPGIQAVAWSDSLPPGGWNNDRRFSDFIAEGKLGAIPAPGGAVVYREVTPDYFPAFDIPILRGRNFSEQDRRLVAAQQRAANVPVIPGQHLAAETGNAVAQKFILSELMAKRLFPGENPVGRLIRMGPKGAWSTVIGVAADVKNGGLTERNDPEVYALRGDAPYQWDGDVALNGSTGGSGPVMIIKTVLPLPPTIAWIHTQVAHLDPQVPMNIEPMTEYVGKLASRPRFATALLTFFACMGMTMAVIGLYGVVTFLALQRTREIGVRIAVGANRMDILKLIAREGMRLLFLGGGTGLLVAFAMVRLLRGFLFHIETYDPISFLSVAALLLLAATLATLAPGLSAMKTDPIVALRYE